jgi:hypothetical protein
VEPGAGQSDRYRRGAAKVCGVGWAKTGTTTLGDCLEILGYRHQRAQLDLAEDLGRGDLDRILEIAAAADSMEDWPWLLLYRELDRAFPGSKFVLTTREPTAWLASYRNMLEGQGEATEAMNQIRRILYGLPFPHVTDEALVARVRRHEQDVRDYFAGRPEDLLEVRWAAGDGWAQLCSFLDRPVPGVPFPHSNPGRYGPR